MERRFGPKHFCSVTRCINRNVINKWVEESFRGAGELPGQDQLRSSLRYTSLNLPRPNSQKDPGWSIHGT